MPAAVRARSTRPTNGTSTPLIDTGSAYTAPNAAMALPVSATGSVHRRNKRSTVLIAQAYGRYATAVLGGRLRLVGLRAKQPGATDDCRCSSVAGVC
jgi:hypothetical protein